MGSFLRMDLDGRGPAEFLPDQPLHDHLAHLVAPERNARLMGVGRARQLVSQGVLAGAFGIGVADKFQTAFPGSQHVLPAPTVFIEVKLAGFTGKLLTRFAQAHAVHRNDAQHGFIGG
ncbi:hypothetical protein NGUA07_00005 [Salmonella enterica]|nr:hypothetical protein NGUA07_00005 [Salmonella enterica]